AATPEAQEPKPAAVAPTPAPVTQARPSSFGTTSAVPVPQEPKRALSTSTPPPRSQPPKTKKSAQPASIKGPYLKVLAGTNQGDQFALPAHGHVRIGRAPDVEAQLDDARVSRYHCRLQVESGRVTVVDLGSKTGTLVNDRPLVGSRLLLTG